MFISKFFQRTQENNGAGKRKVNQSIATKLSQQIPLTTVRIEGSELGQFSWQLKKQSVIQRFIISNQELLDRLYKIRNHQPDWEQIQQSLVWQDLAGKPISNSLADFARVTTIHFNDENKFEDIVRFVNSFHDNTITLWQQRLAFLLTNGGGDLNELLVQKLIKGGIKVSNTHSIKSLADSNSENIMIGLKSFIANWSKGEEGELNFFGRFYIQRINIDGNFYVSNEKKLIEIDVTKPFDNKPLLLSIDMAVTIEVQDQQIVPFIQEIKFFSYIKQLVIDYEAMKQREELVWEKQEKYEPLTDFEIFTQAQARAKGQELLTLSENFEHFTTLPFDPIIFQAMPRECGKKIFNNYEEQKSYYAYVAQFSSVYSKMEKGAREVSWRETVELENELENSITKINNVLSKVYGENQLALFRAKTLWASSDYKKNLPVDLLSRLTRALGNLASNFDLFAQSNTIKGKQAPNLIDLFAFLDESSLAVEMFIKFMLVMLNEKRFNALVSSRISRKIKLAVADDESAGGVVGFGRMQTSNNWSWEGQTLVCSMETKVMRINSGLSTYVLNNLNCLQAYNEEHRLNEAMPILVCSVIMQIKLNENICLHIKNLELISYTDDIEFKKTELMNYTDDSEIKKKGSLQWKI